jgi:hypothetical protein
MGASAPYQVTDEDRAAIAAAISQDEIVELALTLGNIPAPSGKELEVANYVYDWMAREGFSPRKVGATPERPNIIGTHGGKGPNTIVGKNLLFTAHLDTEAPTWNPDLDAYKYAPRPWPIPNGKSAGWRTASCTAIRSPMIAAR